MSALSHEALDALAPLRAFLASDAHREVTAVERESQTQVDALEKKAKSECDRILAEAVEKGTDTAHAVAALRSARVRRQANQVVLSQREAIRQTVRASIAAAATALRDEPRYSELRARLAARGRAVLGSNAVIADSPQGGVIASAASRRLDLSLPVLALSTLDEMGTEVSSLWNQ